MVGKVSCLLSCFIIHYLRCHFYVIRTCLVLECLLLSLFLCIVCFKNINISNDAGVDPNNPNMINCPIEHILRVLIPRGLTWLNANWTEPSATGSVTMDKSHVQPTQWMQVGGSVPVRYAFRDGLGNMIAECLFTLLGIQGEQLYQ